MVHWAEPLSVTQCEIHSSTAAQLPVDVLYTSSWFSDIVNEYFTEHILTSLKSYFAQQLRNMSNAPVKCLSVQEATHLLCSEEFNVDHDAEVIIDLVNIPPDDDLSDEDEVDDDNTLIPMVKDVPGAIEIHTTQTWPRNEEKTTSGLCWYTSVE